MMLKYVSMSALTAGAAVATILFGAPAQAQEPAQECTQVAAGQVCDQISQSATPPVPAGGAGSANEQNGAYGPNGNQPPVGN